MCIWVYTIFLENGIYLSLKTKTKIFFVNCSRLYVVKFINYENECVMAVFHQVNRSNNDLH